jgi:cytoskeletal protein CcmA (bactofilin family)
VIGERKGNVTVTETAISVIGPGMKFVGDCETEATVRIDGTVEGSVRAAKSVVITKNGIVTGDVTSAEAVVAGTVRGSVTCQSRLEFESTGRIDGEVTSPRLQIGDGAIINARVTSGTASGTQSASERKLSRSA